MSWKTKEEKANIARKRALEVLKQNNALHLVDENIQKNRFRQRKIPKLPEKPTFDLPQHHQSDSVLPPTKKSDDIADEDNINKKEYHKNWERKGDFFRHKFSGVVISQYFFHALLRTKKISADKTFDFSEVEKHNIKDGWKAIKDEDSKDMYYWNYYTNKTQWTAPT